MSRNFGCASFVFIYVRLTNHLCNLQEDDKHILWGCKDHHVDIRFTKRLMSILASHLVITLARMHKYNSHDFNCSSNGVFSLFILEKKIQTMCIFIYNLVKVDVSFDIKKVRVHKYTWFEAIYST